MLSQLQIDKVHTLFLRDGEKEALSSEGNQ
jgi:hypothetical protein